MLIGWVVTAIAAPSSSDVAGLDRVDSVDLAPDGESLIYALTERTPPAQEGGEWTVRSQLWQVRDLGGDLSAPEQITTADASATAPAYSPDGQSVAFLRKVDDRMALHIQVLGEPAAVPLDTGSLAPEAFGWGPDGRWLIFSAPEPEPEERVNARLQAGGAFSYGREYRPSVLWTIGAESGSPIRVGSDPAHVAEFAVSPDGASVAVVMSPTADPASGVLRTVAVVDLATGMATVLDAVPRAATRPRWSPDSSRVAWLSTRGTLTLRNVLAVAPRNGGQTADAARTLDTTLLAAEWSGDDHLLALAFEHTRTKLYRLGADGTEVVPLAGIEGRTVLQGLEGDREGQRFATISQSPQVPGEPAWFDVEGRGGAVAHPNDVASWGLGQVEVVTWRGPSGALIEGVLTLPHDAPEGPVPLMVYPHGGPDSLTTESFDERARFFAGHGFAVLRPNYRGSIGYGRDFYVANRGKLGRIEYGDIEAGVDALVKGGRADPERLVYGGWSWGGTLAAYTIGHTDRYRAAVAGAAIVDFVSEYALSSISHGAPAQWEFFGDPWTRPRRYARNNPMLSLFRVSTPTLVAHGEADQRVAFSSSVILWRALSDVGCEVEFYSYPGAGHSLSDPRHLMHLLTGWAHWYESHLAQN